ncbi:uncharacterized protein TNCV_4598381 [Trichonephila clavipes]|nr:uncharacterized protein TNCV_4598381 [Trichonephila clavipes]
MPRASTKVFKKRRGVFNKGRCNKSNDGCGESNSTVPKRTLLMKRIVLMVQSFVLMKLNHLPVKKKLQQEKPVNTVWQKLFVKPLMKMMEKGTLLLLLMVAGRSVVFSSKNGLVTVTSVDPGKVIDVENCICRTKPSIFKIVREILKATAVRWNSWSSIHFQRSQSLYNVRYTKYLGDGDSKTFTSIVENKVYGDHCSVEKLECKPLCGRNRLTEAEIDRLQAYYGLAIRRNLSSVKDMQQAIWAIFLHKLSTDEKPQHGFCPSDTDTWCKFKKQIAWGDLSPQNSLPVDVVEAMRPVFRDLANQNC